MEPHFKCAYTLLSATLNFVAWQIFPEFANKHGRYIVDPNLEYTNCIKFYPSKITRYTKITKIHKKEIEYFSFSTHVPINHSIVCFPGPACLSGGWRCLIVS